MSIIRFFNNETDGKVFDIGQILTENTLFPVSANNFVRNYYAFGGKEFSRFSNGRHSVEQQVVVTNC